MVVHRLLTKVKFKGTRIVKLLPSLVPINLGERCILLLSKVFQISIKRRNILVRISITMMSWMLLRHIFLITLTLLLLLLLLTPHCLKHLQRLDFLSLLVVKILSRNLISLLIILLMTTCQKFSPSLRKNSSLFFIL